MREIESNKLFVSYSFIGLNFPHVSLDFSPLRKEDNIDESSDTDIGRTFCRFLVDINILVEIGEGDNK